MTSSPLAVQRWAAAAVLMLTALPGWAPAAAKNVLLILSDDQGFCEMGATMPFASADTLGSHLAAKYRAIQTITDQQAPIEVCFAAARKCTPTLDALAAEGVLFTDFRAAPTCAPSRAALMTGRYPQRFGIYTNDDVVVDNRGVPPDVRFPIRLFQDAGYMTGLVGKWHLGSRQPGQHPNARGFDYFFGFDSAHTEKYHSRILQRNGAPTPATGWLADQITDEALAFLDRAHAADRPFFLYVAYNEPHGPIPRPPQRYIDHFKSGSEVVDIHFATIYGMDQGIARILASLKRSGRYEDTLILFTSDNGIAQGPYTQGFNARDGAYNCGVPGAGPFRGCKWTPWEGGVRVPLVARLPGGVRATSPALTSIIDLLPTALDFAGIGAGPEYAIEGRSLLPILTGRSDGDPTRVLFWASDAAEPFGNWSPAHGALRDELRRRVQAVKQGTLTRQELFLPAWYVRTPQWKLMAWDKLPPVLIDMIADPYEHADVSHSHPGVVAELQRQFDGWIRTQPAPQTYSRTEWLKMLPRPATPGR